MMLMRLHKNATTTPATRLAIQQAHGQGYIHMHVKYPPQMEDETERRDVFVAIDRATRWAFIDIKSKKTAAATRSVLNALHRAAPFRIQTLLTKPKHPQTNGMVERFNGRLTQVLKSHRFNSAHDLETTLHRFVWL